MAPITVLLARWSAVAPRTRRLVTGAIAALVCAVLIGGILAHPARVPLFATPLHSEQLDEVQERLAAWNVPFTPAADNVIVDARSRSDLLLKLSLAGVPHAHVQTTGETLADVGVLTPQAVIDAQARTGLAGDIEVGLRGVGGIDDARVIIAPAKVAEFADETAEAASASVRISLRSGSTLSPDAIDGIRAFVAASVPGLDPARVTLLDDRGIALDGRSAQADPHAIEGALQSALDATFGADVTVVRVRSERDSQSVERHITRRTPIGSLPIGLDRADESYDASGKRYEKSEEHDDRGSEIDDTEMRAQAGGLARISTAVFVDESRAVDLAKVRELAAATVGFDPRRGDQLVVEAIVFHRDRTPIRDPWWLLYGAIVPLLPALALAIGAVVVTRIVMPPLAAILKTGLERVSIERTSKAVAAYTPTRVRGALANEPPHAAAAVISALPAATAAAVLELYPPHERDAIVRRMQRPNSSLIPDAQELLNQHA